MSILSVQEVSKYYRKHRALHKVSLEVEQGATFGLLGPNGAGKTSLIRIINQITAPDSGSVLLKGKALKPNDVALIGYLPEERGLYPKMKVGEQLLYLAQLRNLSKHDAKTKVKYWMQRFEVEAWVDKNVEELSKGMAQKIQFIATVIHQPELLILDEPFTGFDPINTNLIKSEILKLRDDGATIIFSTHRMESVEEICDEIALINQGEKILSGKLQDIKHDYKSNVFVANLHNSTELQNLKAATIISQEKSKNNLKLKLRLNTSNSNALALELMEYGVLNSFSEELPSLNEIFIKKVQN